MSAAEIKTNLLKQIENLDKSELQEAYGVLLNFINGKNDDWKGLSKKQQTALLKGVKQLDAKQGLPHKTVMRKYRKKYAA